MKVTHRTTATVPDLPPPGGVGSGAWGEDHDIAFRTRVVTIGADVIADSDLGAALIAPGQTTLALAAPGSGNPAGFTAGWFCVVFGPATVVPDGVLIAGDASLTVPAGHGSLVISTGSEYRVVNKHSTVLAALASIAPVADRLAYFTGPTSVDLTPFPEFARLLVAANDDAAARGVLNAAALIGGKVPLEQLPAIAITDTFVVSSQAAMLALTAERGDIAVRNDLNKSFVLSDDDATVLGNWIELLTPTDAVLSVAGKVGNVVLVKADIGGLTDTDTPTFAGLVLAAAGALAFAGRSKIQSLADGFLTLLNNAGSGFDMLRFGGATASFPAIKRSLAKLQARLADDSDYATLEVATQTTGDSSKAAASTEFVQNSLSAAATGALVNVVTAGTTMLDASYNGKTVVVDATAGNITLSTDTLANLPTNFEVHLIRNPADASNNTITFDPDSTVTVDNRPSARLISAGDGATVRRNGSAFVTRGARWKRRIVSFTTPGAATFTTLNEVPLGCLAFKVKAWGGGASGAAQSGGVATGRGAGGGGGGYGEKVVSPADATLALTIASGGAAVTSGSGGNAGGNTTIVGTVLGTLTAAGGTPPGVAGAAAGGAGGNSTNFDVSITGGDGGSSPGVANAFGVGGNSPRGGNGACKNVAFSGQAPGGGGSGENHTGGSSGAGARGQIDFEI